MPWMYNWCFLILNTGGSEFWKSMIITILSEAYLRETLLNNSPGVSCQLASWEQNSSTQGTFWQICSRHALLLNTVNKIPGKNNTVSWTPARGINWWALYCLRRGRLLQIRSLIIIYLVFLASLTTVPVTSLSPLTSMQPTAKNFGNLLT